MANTNVYLPIDYTAAVISSNCANTVNLYDTLSTAIEDVGGCTLGQKYDDILTFLKSFSTIAGALPSNTGTLYDNGLCDLDYLKASTCYTGDDTKTIYDCLDGLKYHYSRDIDQLPDQDNPFSTTGNYYYFKSMAALDVATSKIYVNAAGITAWKDFLTALETYAASQSGTGIKDAIATLIGESIPYVLYDGFCSKKQYFDKYISDADVSYPVKAEMARVSLLTNSYLLSKDVAYEILETNRGEFTTTDDKNTLLKLFLTLGTSLQGKSWVQEYADTNDKSDITDIINGLTDGTNDLDSALIADAIELLEDFNWQSA